MAQGSALSSSDLFEKDVFSEAIKGGEQFLKVIKDTRVEMNNSLAAQKDFVKAFKVNNFDDVKRLNIELKQTAELIKMKQQLEVAEQKVLQQQEILVANKIKSSILDNKLTQEKVKLTREQLKADQDLTKAIEQEEKARRKNEQSLKSVNGEYKKGVQALAQVKQQLKELEYTGRTSGKIYKALGQEFQTLNMRVRDAEEGVGEFQRNVGNYASGFNPLRNSINQLSREMPAFANSVQTGFMAISNNIPAFFDAIGGIKKANAELRAEGQPTQSVFKQLAAGIFSWGTALSVGVTLLTVYGKDIVEFFMKMSKGSTSIKSAAENQKELNAVLKEGTKGGIQEASQLDILYKTATNLNLSIEQRTKATQKMQELYPSYFGNLTTEELLTGKATKQYIKLREAIFDSARAKAIQGKLEERGAERIEKELEIREEIKKAEEEILKLQKSGQDLVIKGSRQEKTQDIVVTNAELIKAQKDLLNIKLKDLKTFNENAFKEDELLLSAQDELYKKSADLEADRITVKESEADKAAKKAAKAAEAAAKKAAREAKTMYSDEAKIIAQTNKLKADAIEDEYTRASAALEAENINMIKEIQNSKATTKSKHEDLLALEMDFHRKKASLTIKMMSELQSIMDKETDEATAKVEKDLQDRLVAEAKIRHDAQLVAIYENDKNAKKELEAKIAAIEEERDILLTNAHLTEDEVYIIKYEAQKKIDDLNKAATDKRVKEALTETDKLIAATDKYLKLKYQKQQDLIKQEIEDNKKAIDVQQRLAERGFANTLAFEEAKAAKLELERKKQQEKEVKQQKIIAFYNLFSSYAKTDPQTALQKATFDTILSELIAGSFYVGTEKVSDDLSGNKFSSGRDGYIIRADGDERIFTGEDNKRIGDISNHEAANILEAYDKGILFNYGNIQPETSTNQSSDRISLMMLSKLDSIAAEIRNKPVVSNDFSNFPEMIQTTIKGSVKEILKYKNRI